MALRGVGTAGQAAALHGAPCAAPPPKDTLSPSPPRVTVSESTPKGLVFGLG